MRDILPRERKSVLLCLYVCMFVRSRESKKMIVFTTQSGKCSLVLLSERGVSEQWEHGGRTGKETTVCSLLREREQRRAFF